MRTRQKNMGSLVARVLGVAGISLCWAVLRAQTPLEKSAEPPCPVGLKVQTDGRCAPSKESNGTPAAPAPNPAQRFPYPGEKPSDAEVPASPGVSPEGASPTPSGEPPAKKPDAPKTPPAYPGESEGTTNPDQFSSSSRAGRTDDADSPDSPLADAGSTGEKTTDEGDVPVKSRRKKLPKVEAQTPEMREAEDLDVADFYAKAGNFAASYARAKDAVSLIPGDAGAHFALAEAARNLGKTDEAREHYNAVLKLDPSPKELKGTEKALAEMGKGGTARKR